MSESFTVVSSWHMEHSYVLVRFGGCAAILRQKLHCTSTARCGAGILAGRAEREREGGREGGRERTAREREIGRAHV